MKSHGEAFPVVKVVTPGRHLIINHMEWKDGALIVTVGSRQDESDVWNFTTTASNYIQELKNGIQALMRSSVADLPGNIEGLARTANARSEFIEANRKRLFPENYPQSDD